MFATSHISLNHPIIAAKQSTVIDHISNGRFALNIVTGWNQPEIDMFGQAMLGHEDRYACAEEWLAIVKRLWTEDERSTTTAGSTGSRRATCSRSRSRRRIRRS